MTRCAVVGEHGLRCKSLVYEGFDKCFVHLNRERSDRRKLPPTLAPASLFDERAETYPKTSRPRPAALVIVNAVVGYATDPYICWHPDMPTFGGSAFECEGCCAQMDEDHGAFA